MATQEVELGKKDGKQEVRRLTDITVDEISLVDSPAVPDAVFVIAKRDTDGNLVHIQKVTKNVANAFFKAVDALRKVATEMDSSGLHILAALMEHVRFAMLDEDGRPFPQAKELEKASQELAQEIDGFSDILDTLSNDQLLKASFLLVEQANGLLASSMKSMQKIGKFEKSDQSADLGDLSNNVDDADDEATSISKEDDALAASSSPTDGLAENNGAEQIEKDLAKQLDEELPVEKTALEEASEILTRQREEEEARQNSEDARILAAFADLSKDLSDLRTEVGQQIGDVRQEFDRARGKVVTT